MTAVIRRKTWEERRADKIEREYVRLSEENRKLKAEYLDAIEQVTDLQIRLNGLMTIIDLQEEVRA